MDREITLRDYGKVLWKGRWLILCAALLAALVGGLLSLAKTTTYRSTASVFMGQATSQSGVPVPTVRTNPATAAQGLLTDEIVGRVATAIGISEDRVRDAISLTAARTAGNANVNQPTIVAIAARDTDRKVARQLAGRYADEVLALANAAYEPQVKTYTDRISSLQAREQQLITDAKVTRNQLVRGGDRASLAIVLNSMQSEMSLVRNDLYQQQLDLQKSKQVEAPSAIGGASTAKSSGGARSRLGSVIFAGLIGAILGIILTLIWKGGPATPQPTDAA